MGRVEKPWVLQMGEVGTGKGGYIGRAGVINRGEGAGKLFLLHRDSRDSLGGPYAGSIGRARVPYGVNGYSIWGTGNPWVFKRDRGGKPCNKITL